jgi:hypothetical protein
MGLIVSPITNHANRLYSHRTAWGRMWSKCLGSKLAFNSDWSREDTVYFEHGMEFKAKSKGLNVFLKDEKSWDKLAQKAEMFSRFSGQLYSLDIECPDYGERLKARVRDHSSSRYKSLDFNKITDLCKSAKIISQDCLNKRGLVLGDSHALASWRTDAYISRNDGKTLNGSIEEGFDTWIEGFSVNSDIEFLRTCFGNIDIRHHLCRLFTDEKNQILSTKNLVDRYFSELNRVQEKFKIKSIEVVSAIPIEDESRKLPRTGYFKNKPFWGRWKERDAVHRVFNDRCLELCQKFNYNLIEWPKYFYEDTGKLDFQYMERPRSVHISPEHYLWSITNE